MPCTNLNDAFELGMLLETKRFHAIFHFIRSIRFGFVLMPRHHHHSYNIAHTLRTNSRTSFSFYFEHILFIFVMKWQFTLNITNIGEEVGVREDRMKNYTHFARRRYVYTSIFQWWFCIDHFRRKKKKFLSEINQQIIDLNAICIVQCHANIATSTQQMPENMCCMAKKKL